MSGLWFIEIKSKLVLTSASQGYAIQDLVLSSSRAGSPYKSDLSSHNKHIVCIEGHVYNNVFQSPYSACDCIAFYRGADIRI